MTAIGASVIVVDNVGAQYRLIVPIGFPRYRGSFPTLKLAEKKRFTGLTRNDHLDLIYHEDPHLKSGQPFPLWTLQ
jgi:hypothetical protein